MSAIADLARKLKKERPELIYLLDRASQPFPTLPFPVLTYTQAVMGDAGRLYVAADVIPVYREMLPLATLIAPNWFEVEYVPPFPYHTGSAQTSPGLLPKSP